jgi:hypothetical protein
MRSSVVEEGVISIVGGPDGIKYAENGWPRQ